MRAVKGVGQIRKTSSTKRASDRDAYRCESARRAAALSCRAYGQVPLPPLVSERLALFMQLQSQRSAQLEERAQRDSKPIRVSLPDGRELDAQAWKTSPLELAARLGRSLADGAVVARVNGVLWDLGRPLEQDGTLEILGFDSGEGKGVFWHSSAHVLGSVMECLYRGSLCHGPSTDSGFFYDMQLDPSSLPSNDLPALQELCTQMIRERQPFERLEVTRGELLELFKHNKFKLQIIEEKIATQTATVYRCGSLVDLCRGPHLPHTGKIKAFKLLKTSSAQWRGDPSLPPLHRVIGVSFPESRLLRDWEQEREEARGRDHRRIGRDQELYFFHELSPGSCFFLPKGAHLYNTLTDFIKVRVSLQPVTVYLQGWELLFLSSVIQS
ncbi:threonine--tRNA ligase 2, cytoplasmic-like, partial [Acipenser ruthenus]|uniref:threonine--tRNA ligase 2, cytoplasmic-like n=1 Tax=Acipenser ruthenus TaxID=7906 RepID=UPI00274254EE